MPGAIRIGVLNDMSDGPPGPTDIVHWIRLSIGDLVAAGRIDCDIEIVEAWGLGLPSGSAAAVERAYVELVERNVQLIIGPAIGDNALVATPLAERHQVPTINWAGTERARSEYMFHLQVGSHEDESIVLARHLVALGAGRVVVVYDQSPIGCRYFDFFRKEARILGLAITASADLAPLAGGATSDVRAVFDARSDALVYLGLGVAAPVVAGLATARGRAGPRAMNTAGLRGYAPEFARVIDGWHYVDMHSDHNTTLAALRKRLGIPDADSLKAAKGYDLGRLVAEGIARAPELSRKGMLVGLEQVKWLPAAEGHEGTLLGFGNFDRGALHGRYLVLREWQGGRSVQIDESGRA